MSISRKSRSILEEINAYVPKRSKDEVVESRAQHIIASAINLFETIDRVYSAEEAESLKKRFMSSIKGADPSRFTRMVNKVKGACGDDCDEQT